MVNEQKKKSENGKVPAKRRYLVVRVFFLMIVSLAGIGGGAQPARASLCIPCGLCNPADLLISAAFWEFFEGGLGVWDGFTELIMDNIDQYFRYEARWIVTEFYDEFWLPALEELNMYLSTFSMKQVEMFGMMLDAKNHLETRRLFFELQAEAHRDYHPSEGICWIGTSVRSMAATETKAKVNLLALTERGMRRNLSSKTSLGVDGAEADQRARWVQFTRRYCDPKDNNWTGPGTGLDLACDHDGAAAGANIGATNRDRVNRDVNFTRLVDEPRTINLDYTDNTMSEEDEDILAMSANLYGNHPVLKVSRTALTTTGAKSLYLLTRSITARRNVAQHSFNSIVAMKSSGSNGLAGAPPNTASFMGAIIRELLPVATSPAQISQQTAEIFEMIGRNPSYYAQLEILAKKIYQNPDFFADLYDKPANVARKSVAMKAIDLMLDRALYESELRQEMVLSVLLSTEMRKEYRKLNQPMARKK